MEGFADEKIQGVLAEPNKVVHATPVKSEIVIKVTKQGSGAPTAVKSAGLTDKEKKALQDRYVNEVIIPAIEAGEGAEFFKEVTAEGQGVGDPIIPSPEELKEFFIVRDGARKALEERGLL